MVRSQNEYIFRAADENNSEFDSDHNSHWGKLHKVEDIKLEWHGESRVYHSKGQGSFSPLQSLQTKRFPSYSTFSIASYLLHWIRSKVFFRPPVPGTVSLVMIFVGKHERLRCRYNTTEEALFSYLCIARSAWQGLPTLCKEPPKNVVETGLNPGSEVDRLIVQTIDVQAGFALIDPEDWRYQMAYGHRLRLGRVVHGAALALKRECEAEDHIDAILSVVNGIDTYLLDYALRSGVLVNLKKNFVTVRESVTTRHLVYDINQPPTDSIECGQGRKRTRDLSISGVFSSITASGCTCTPYFDVDRNSMITSSKIS
jgi:proteasome activator subunit 4